MGRRGEIGCRYLHFGYESGNDRVLKLMDKATNLDAIRTNLAMSAKYGIWNHIMGFFGFPGETQEEANDSKQFVHDNRDSIHSLGFMTLRAGQVQPGGDGARRSRRLCPVTKSGMGLGAGLLFYGG